MSSQGRLRGRWSPTRWTTCRWTEIKGRVAATLALIYPPGIGVVVPGERWDDRGAADARLLSDVRGVVQPLSPASTMKCRACTRRQMDGRIKFYTYVVRE